MANFFEDISDVQDAWSLGGGKKVRKASFKGVEFGVFSSQDTRGRQVVIHDYPLRDKIFAEDMGRSKRLINVSGFLAGSNYASKRNVLIKALEEEGPGTLVHPWLGSLEVALASPASFSHSSEDIGMCSFQLSFVEVSPPENPGKSLFFPDLSIISEALAKLQAALNFDFLINIKGAAEEALAYAHEWAAGLYGIFNTVYEGLMIFPAIAEDIAAFFGEIETLGSFSELLSGFWPERNYKATGGGEVAMTEAQRLLKLSLESPPIPVPEGLGTKRTQVAENMAAIADFFREMTGIQGFAAAAWAEPASKKDAEELRELVLKVSDFILENASGDELYKEVSKTVGYVLNAISEAAKYAPEIKVVEEKIINSAFPVIWNRVLMDSKSDDLEAAFGELMARNKIRHPGFIPAGPLEILLV